MSKVISSFRSLRTGSHRCLLYSCVFCGVILHTMWLGKGLKLLCILPFAILCLSVIRMMFVKILLAVCMLVSIAF